MNTKTTLIAALILALLVGYIYFIDNPAMKKQREKELAEQKVYSGEIDDITGFKVRTGTEKPSVKLRKKNKNWMITSPVKTEADRSALKGILDSLKNMKKQGSFETTNYKDYRLDKPEVELTLTTAEEDKWTLKIGKKNPMSKTVYATSDGQSGVFLLEPSAKSDLNKSLIDLRYGGLGHFDSFKVKDFSLVNKTGKRFHLRKSNKQWKLLEPLKTQADQSFVSDFLYDLENMEAKSFISEDPSSSELEKHGFEDPVLKVSINKNGDEVPIVIAEGKEHFYARRDSDGALIEIDPLRLKKKYLDIDIKKLRRKKLFTLSRWAVKSLQVKSGTESFTLKKTKNKKWRLKNQPDTRINSKKVKSFLDKLLSLKAKAFRDGKISDPELRIALRGENGKESISAVKSSEKYYLVGSSDIKEIMKVPAEKIDELTFKSDFFTGKSTKNKKSRGGKKLSN